MFAPPTLDKFYGSRIAWNQNAGWKVSLSDDTEVRLQCRTTEVQVPIKLDGPPFKSTLTEAAPPFAVFEEPALSAVEGVGTFPKRQCSSITSNLGGFL
jgi:hypothetical protein